MDGLSDFCKMFMVAMALAPDSAAEATVYGGDMFYANNAAAERCAARGGIWAAGGNAGVFYLYFGYPRSSSLGILGGRPAFYEKQ